MAYFKSPVGICKTCKNLATCSHRKRRGFDGDYCEMFQIPQPGDGWGNDHGIGAVPASHSDDAIMNDLCVNCANRSTCRLPQPTGGVWHCEEYI